MERMYEEHHPDSPVLECVWQARQTRDERYLVPAEFLYGSRQAAKARPVPLLMVSGVLVEGPVAQHRVEGVESSAG